MALARVMGSVGSDAGDLLVVRDLVKQLRQLERVPNVAAGDLDRPDLQCFLINPTRWVLRHTRRSGPPYLRVPLTFALDLDASAVDQQVERTERPPMRNVHGKGLLIFTQSVLNENYAPFGVNPTDGPQGAIGPKPPRGRVGFRIPRA